jgi:hypothetical protein
MAHLYSRFGSDEKSRGTTPQRLFRNGIAALAISTSFIAPAHALTESVICNNAPPTLTAQVDLEIAVQAYVAVRINVTNAYTRENAYGAWRVIDPGISVAQTQGFNMAAGSGLWYTWAEFLVYYNTYGWQKNNVRYIPVLAGGADFATVQYYCRF